MVPLCPPFLFRFRNISVRVYEPSLLNLLLRDSRSVPAVHVRFLHHQQPDHEHVTLRRGPVQRGGGAATRNTRSGKPSRVRGGVVKLPLRVGRGAGIIVTYPFFAKTHAREMEQKGDKSTQYLCSITFSDGGKREDIFFVCFVMLLSPSHPPWFAKHAHCTHL